MARTKAFVAELLNELPAAPGDAKFASTATTRERKLSTIALRCGSRRVEAGLLTTLEAEFAAGGIYTHRPLSSPELKRDDRIKLSRLSFAPEELFFSNEQLLKEYLLAGIGHVEPLRDLELEAKEFALPSRRRVDLLCRERRKGGKGALVAVELKKAQQADGVATQVIRYLEELSVHPLAKDRSVRAIIISGRADEIEARQIMSEKRFQIDWYCYSVSLGKRATNKK